MSEQASQAEKLFPMPLQVGPYRVVRRLGAGEIVETFLGEDTGQTYRGDAVTIRRVRPELLEEDPLYRRGLIVEGQLGKLIRHDNVIHIYDLIILDEIPYLVSEYVDGFLLPELVQKVGGRLDPPVVVEIVRQVAGGLYALHSAVDEQGVPLMAIHQDVRPSNIGLNRHGDVKLLELGIARSRVTGHGGAQVRSTVPAYQSPEQARGEVNLSPATDQYSLGVVLLELLTGVSARDRLEQLIQAAERQERPAGEVVADPLGDPLGDPLVLPAAPILPSNLNFASPLPAGEEARMQWARAELPRLLRRLVTLPGGLEDLLERILAVDPGSRYPSLKEVGAELLRWQWGFGAALDFRRYVEQLLGEGAGTGSAPPSLEAAANASFVAKSIVYAMEDVSSSFVPPREVEAVPQRKLNLAADPGVSSGPPAYAGGAILEPVGSPDWAQPGAVAPPTMGYPSGQPAAQPAKKRGGPSRQSLLMVGTGVLLLVLAVAGAMMVLRRPAPVAQPVESTPPPLVQPGEVVPGNQPTDLRSMLEKAQEAKKPKTDGMAGLRGLRDEASSAGGQAQGGDTLGQVTEPGGILPPEPMKKFVGKRRPGSSTLTIETSPPGEKVILDGNQVVTAPVTLERIPAGQHQLIFRSDELGLRWIQILDLRAGQHFRGTWSLREGRWLAME